MYVALAGNHYVDQISLELLEIHLLHLPRAGITLHPAEKILFVYRL